MRNTYGQVLRRAAISLALASIFALAVPRAFARHHGPNPVAPPASVVAHLTMPDGAGNQLTLQDSGNRHYLFVEEASRQGFMIVDVTTPDQPAIIKHHASPNGATGKLQAVGANLFLAGPETTPSQPVSPAATLTLLDTSDPVNPRVVQTFPGVTSTLADSARNLVYIAGAEGLWILKGTEPRAAFEVPECQSGDASNDVASCR